MKITFRARVWKCIPAFQVPWPIARKINVWNKDDVMLAIKRGKSEIYNGQAHLTSGTEVRSGKAIKGLRNNEWITVTIRPPLKPP